MTIDSLSMIDGHISIIGYRFVNCELVNKVFNHRGKLFLIYIYIYIELVCVKLQMYSLFYN